MAKEGRIITTTGATGRIQVGAPAAADPVGADPFVRIRRCLAGPPGRPLGGPWGDSAIEASAAGGLGQRPDGDGVAGVIAAAVLVGLIARPHGVAILLTQRTATLADHAGEVCLPGGRIEAGDEDAVAAARREAWEEVGLAPDRAEIVGHLPPYLTGTGFRVVPVVAILDPPARWRPDPVEVAAVFEAPLDWVLAADSLRLQRRHIAGRERHFYSGTWQGFEIWGATAGMLLSLKAALDRPDESLLADSRA